MIEPEAGSPNGSHKSWSNAWCRSRHPDERRWYHRPAMTTVLYLGLDPRVVDFSLLPDLTEEKLTAQLDEQVAQLRAAGFDAVFVGVDRGETAAAVTASALASRPHDIVLIGAGLRASPLLLELFENLINVVHERAPRARICFNTTPRDSEAAVRRWADAARGG